MSEKPEPGLSEEAAMTVQWWLASLDRYGNAKLVDGPHSKRAGVVEAMRITNLLHSGDNFLRKKIGEPNPHGYAIARVELEPIP